MEKAPTRKRITRPAAPKDDGKYELSANLSSITFTSIDQFMSSDVPIEELRDWLENPNTHIEQLRRLAWRAYRTNGSVGTAVDYLRSMHTLDGVVSCKRKTSGAKPKNFKANSTKMSATLEKIQYKQFVRDALLCNMNDGMSVYYFEVTEKPMPSTLFLSDLEVQGITDINEIGMNAAILSLPINHCRIIGRRDSVPVVAFDLRYFDSLPDHERKRALQGMPKEISDAHTVWTTQGSSASNWKILDHTKTICTKICSPISSPFGFPFILRAISDLLYCEQFMDTKRSVLDDVLNNVIYHTLPESATKGLSSLSRPQQEQQHNTIRDALANKNNRNGRTFFTLAPGSKLNRLDIDTSLLAENVEEDIGDKIPSALGISPTLLTGKSNSTYASATLNAEFVAANVFMWISDIMAELNKVINENIIRDKTCRVSYEVLPVTYVNREKMFEFTKALYAECGGSLGAVVAASGMNVEAYISLMEHERESGYDEKFRPHQSMYTSTGSQTDGGRPKKSGSENPATQNTKSNNSNSTPRPGE